jgi:hypothetical protein
MRAPGYRDRVAHVSMSKDEGGMNLAMPPPTIAALTARGRAAASRLRRAYTPPDPDGETITWDNHRWVRLRSALAVLEEMHERFAAGYSKDPDTAQEQTYAQMLRRGSKARPGSYRWGDGQRVLAEEEIEEILDGATAARRSGKTLAGGAPKPRPQGRIAPTD